MSRKPIRTAEFNGRRYRVFDLKTETGQHEVICVPETYECTEDLAVEIYSVTNGNVTGDFTTLTRCFGTPFESETRAYLDTNNCPWAERFVTRNKIARNEYMSRGSGYCRYPLYEFDLSRLTVGEAPVTLTDTERSTE